jgi:hypothetical protein
MVVAERQGELMKGGARLVDGLWRRLRQPGLLIGTGAVAFVLLLCAWRLPQLPGQLSGDPATAARWLAGVSATYGVAGELLRVLGLFNVLHGIPLQLVLLLLSLILVVQLGESLALLWRYRQVPGLLGQLPTYRGAPLSLPAGQPLYRQRWASIQTPVDLTERLAALLTTHFEGVTQRTVPLPPDALSPAADGAALAEETETQLLALRNARWVGLRPFLLIGLLLAVLVVWLIVLFGWEISSPMLAPGERYRYAARDVQLEYRVQRQADQATGQLAAVIGGAQGVATVADTVSLSVGTVAVHGVPGAPGLLISTGDGLPGLTLAGQSETAPSLGLIFPSPGSEQSVILPAEAIGLRIVRLAEATGVAYLLEIYEGESSQPTERVQIGEQPVEVLTFGAEDIKLEIVALPSLVVALRYLPGVWLLWVALGLVLLGALGYVRRPALVLAQVGPWPVGRTVVVVQSDDRRQVAQLFEQLSTPDEEPVA